MTPWVFTIWLSRSDEAVDGMTTCPGGAGELHLDHAVGVEIDGCFCCGIQRDLAQVGDNRPLVVDQRRHQHDVAAV